MKSSQYNLFLIFLVFLTTSVFGQHNYLTFTPESQSVNVNSGEEITVNVQINCYGSQSGFSNFFINFLDVYSGYLSHSPGSGSLKVGDVVQIEFKFRKDVTSTTTNSNKFKADWYDEVGNFHSEVITINVTYIPASCSLSYPSGRTTSSITANSAKINWNSVSGNNGYQYQFKKASSSSWTTGNTGSTSRTLTGLQSNTNYQWKVKTKCSNGAYGNYSSSLNFTTLEECQENLTITQNVNSSQTDIQESSNTIIATNIIFNGATAEYDAGTTVFLKPNFHAKSGSNFRAYIEGCQNTKSGKKSIIEDVIINDDTIIDYNEFVKVYPNPTKGNLNIKSDKEVLNWTITNAYGKSYFKGNSSKEIHMDNLPNGVYFLKAILINGKVISKTIIKNN